MTDPLEDLQHTLGSFTAWSTFSAGLFLTEFHEESGRIDHTGIFIHNDETTGAHDSADLSDLFIICQGVQRLSRDTSAGRAAQLGCFELLATRDATTDIKDDIADRGTHGNLHQTNIVHCPGHRKNFCSLGTLGSNGCIPVTALEDDLAHIGIGFNVIEDRRLLPETLACRERRPWPGHSALTFDGIHQSGFFTADKCAGTLVDLDIKAVA